MIGEIRNRPSWTSPQVSTEGLVVDVEYLVARLPRLSTDLETDAGKAAADIDFENDYTWSAARRTKLVGELQMLALDLAPGTELDVTRRSRERGGMPKAGLPHASGSSTSCASPTSRWPASSSTARGRTSASSTPTCSTVASTTGTAATTRIFSASSPKH